ncbi:hypothetical protein D3C80_2032700 [compost metagenome]
MTHGGQKQGLGFVGGISGVSGLLQSLGVLYVASDIIEGIQPDILALIAGCDITYA